ncbi:MAG: ferrochelatase [Bacteroidia bacterium 43-41]|nr:ferrochelatase [Petrimonas sp.]OJV35058.1 MAG: ferrochelatase [Bacteroidia bacterium 43-41]
MRGILLINVGTPATCSKEAVKKFVGDMLSDPLVTGKPELVSNFLAKKIIAPVSSGKSFNKYSQIWRKEEPAISPMIYFMRKLAQLLEERKNIPVEIAMRYGEPGIEQAFKNLEKKCPLLHEVVVFPLYPHYAQSTTQTTIDEIGRIFYKHPHSYRLKIVEPYFDHPAFINALAKHAEPYLKGIDKLVFCYHSLPVDQVEVAWKKGKEFDYVYQLKETNRLFCKKLNIELQYTYLLYASQRGNNWLKPFLDADISDFPQLGWKKVAVIAPGFPADNLETLFDIDLQARELFMKAGGEEFVFVPSLNYSDEWIEAIWKITVGV